MRYTSITIHCTATHPGMVIGVHEIRKWHLKRGWEDVGYHFVIRRSGVCERGRALHRQGAHVKHHNKRNIGVCLVGGIDKDGRPEDNFTKEQFATLRSLIIDYTAVFNIRAEGVKGHRDWPGVKKACPCFSVSSKLKEWGVK